MVKANNLGDIRAAHMHAVLCLPALPVCYLTPILFPFLMLKLWVVNCLALRSTCAVMQALSLLPGAHFDIIQTVDSNGMPSERPFKANMHQQQQHHQQARVSAMRASTPAASSSGPGTPGSPAIEASVVAEPCEVVLVVFLGGVTYSEISALRYLQSRKDSKHRYELGTSTLG